MPDEYRQQTFEDDDREMLIVELGSVLNNSALRALYLASYSESFGKDLRDLLADVVTAPVLREWEGLR